ncbi:mariner transposase [Trichonephila clavipes]|nr:mariner transposase [Trichonephila clavipes]
MNCHKEHRSGRPNEVTTLEIVKKIHKAVLDDRRLKVCGLADIVGISKSAVHHILSENLDMRKLKVSPQKSGIFALFHNYGGVHPFASETKEQSKQWFEKGEQAPKKSKTVPSARKVIAPFFGMPAG